MEVNQLCNTTPMEELVVGFQQVSYCDWPGKITTVLFLSDCNLYCPTCHNWGIAHPKTKLEFIDLDIITDYVNSQKKWLDGITISGGEPTVNERVIDLCFYLKEACGTKIKLDTNGMNPYLLEDMINCGCIDSVAMDIKAPFELYPEITNCPNIPVEAFESVITRSIDVVRSVPAVELYFRTTLVPKINKNGYIEDIKKIIPIEYRHYLQTYVPPRRNSSAG